MVRGRDAEVVYAEELRERERLGYHQICIGHRGGRGEGLLFNDSSRKLKWRIEDGERPSWERFWFFTAGSETLSSRRGGVSSMYIHVK